jgi:hypothetical protein
VATIDDDSALAITVPYSRDVDGGENVNHVTCGSLENCAPWSSLCEIKLREAIDFWSACYFGRF